MLKYLGNHTAISLVIKNFYKNMASKNIKKILVHIFDIIVEKLCIYDKS